MPSLLISEVRRQVASKLGLLESDGRTLTREILLVGDTSGALLNARLPAGIVG